MCAPLTMKGFLCMRCRLVTSRWRNGSSNMTQMRALATIMVQLLCIRHHIGGRPLWLNCSSKRGADLDSRDNDSWTPFHLAALRGHLETVKLPIECGADRNIRDDENKTAYLWIWPPTMTDSIANFLSRSTLLWFWKKRSIQLRHRSAHKASIQTLRSHHNPVEEMRNLTTMRSLRKYTNAGLCLPWRRGLGNLR